MTQQAPPTMAYQQMSPVSQWSDSCIDCFNDTSSCCDLYWCTCCALARQWDAANGIRNSLNMPVCLATFCCGCVPCVIISLRFQVAAKYNIDESCLIKFCLPWCFPACSACQTYRELNNRGSYPGGTCCISADKMPVQVVLVQAPMGQAGYQQQPGGYQQVPQPGYAQMPPQQQYQPQPQVGYGQPQQVYQ